MSKIFVRIFVDRKKCEMFTGVSIAPSAWDKINQKALKDKKINEELINFQSSIYEIKKEILNANQILTAKGIKDRLEGKVDITGLVSYYTAYIKKLIEIPDHSKEIAGKHKNVLNKISLFLNSRKQKEIMLNHINFKWIQDFDHFLLTYKSPLLAKPMGRNTANKQHAKLRSILEMCRQEGCIKTDPYSGIKFKSTKTNREYLTEEELNLIYNHDLSGNMSLIKVRDIFFFSIYTGLRYIDAINLKTENIKKDKNEKFWIELTQIKTKEKLVIPMLKKAIEIYDKYNDLNRKITGNVLPKMSNQKINVYLKTIADIAGIKKKLTHHIARHTFATTITLSNEIPLEIVSKWLGHSSIKTSQIYAKISNQYSAKMAEKLDEKLGD